MPPFAWQQFLDRNGIAYRTSGRNVASGHVAVKCPWCGAADPSEHMGISLRGEGWGCLRDKAHRGKRPARLIRALLNCSWDEALRQAGDETSSLLAGTFAAEFEKIFGPAVPIVREPLKLPPEFKPFSRHLVSARPYRDHLMFNRRITPYDVDHRVTQDYDLHYSTHGQYGGRIIFPIYFEGQLVAWTGRAISELARVRYKAIEKEIAVVSHYLLWYDDLMDCGAHTLIACEGPFDSLKINLLGRRHGIRSTCFFTSAPTKPQIDLLHDLVPRFKHCFLLLDRDTELMAMHVKGELAGLGFKALSIPAHRKDPDQMNERELLALVS